MSSKQDAYRGCLLGLAIGDAMGYPVDTKTWGQIQEDYGPYGLMGYDLRNGYAEVSSHTQIAAFSCNGLLLGQTRGQVYGKMAPFVRYVHLAQQEWAIGQRRYDQPGRNHCWVFRVSDMRHRHCTDTRMVETLNRCGPGSMEEPVNRYDTPASLASAIAAGLFRDPGKLGRNEADRLGAECVALTHGHPHAFLPGAVIAHLIGDCLRNDIVISVKSSDVRLAVKAYEYVASKTDYPLHLGVTEAGREYHGTIKNAIGIGSLLLKGIGDTLRVSLSADPMREVIAGKAILSALDLAGDSVKIIACPTCGRCAWDCMGFAEKVEKHVEFIKKPLKIAVMGCVVNGPGEASDADLGVAGGKDGCVIFVKGKIVKKVAEKDLEKEFFEEIDRCLQ